ncbi:hypothetical protein D0T87_16155 [Bacteroides sp. 51]|nr:hypothetical protein [Bacteroides sp. 51]
MHYLIQICKVAMAVFFTAIVAILFSTLTGCRGCSSEDKEVRWVPAPQDTIPEILVEDSLGVDSIEIVNVVSAIAPVKKKPSRAEQKSIALEETYQSVYHDERNIHLWSEEFDLDSIELTIIISDLEMQITQNLN